MKNNAPVEIPEFLCGIAYMSRDVKRIAPHMGNWIRVHAYLMTLPHDKPSTVHELMLMLLYELHNGRRLDVMHRLFRRMNVTRRNLEERQLFTPAVGHHEKRA